MPKYIDRLNPIVKSEIEKASQASYFTKEEVLNAVFANQKVKNIEIELAKIAGWDFPIMLHRIIGTIAMGYLTKTKDDKGLPIFRSHAVPGGRRRYLRFLDMGYSQMQLCLGERARKIEPIVRRIELDRIVLEKLGADPKLKVRDVIDAALEEITRKEIK